MISRIWTGSLLLLLGVVVVALVHACLYERNFHPYRAFWQKFRKLPWWKQVAAIFFVGILWAYAGEKPRGGNFMMATLLGDPTPVTDEWTEFTPITSTNTTRTLDGDDFRRGFVFVRIDTNCPASIFNSQLSILNTQFSSDWCAFGAASDWVYANVEWGMWNGEWGTGNGEEARLRIYSDGWVEMQGSTRSVSAPYQDGDDGTGTPRTLKFFPFRAPLGIVPESNWHLMGNGEQGTGNGGESQFWHFVTPSNTLQLTWQNVLFGRDTNTPVSAQMEACPDGRFAYRYDLRNLKLRIENGELDAEELTNIVLGASIGSLPLQFTLADLVINTPFSILRAPFSMYFHPLSAEDSVNQDRDGDGLSLLDELFAFGSDPEHPDTDCDGVPDGAEVARGTDPGSRDTDADGFADGTDVQPLDVDAWTDANGDGLPDAWKDGWFGANATVAADADANADGISNLAALLMGVNPVVPCVEGFVFPYGTGASGIRTWEIATVAFEFAGRESLTNLVSRTFAISRESPWEQYFVSSRPDRAEGWSMADVTLRYGLDGEPATNAVPASPRDSWRIPLGEMMPQSISFRLDADGAAPFLSAPLYLLRWTPHIEFLPSENVTVIDGTNGHVYAAAKRNPDTGAYCVPFRADAAGIPSRHGVAPEVAADLARPPVDGVAVSNGMFTASDPLMADLPPEGTDLSKRLLFYDIDIGRTGAVSSGPRASPYASPYPLTSSSLRKAFHAATGVTADGTVTLTLSPDVPELGFTTGTSFLRGGLRSLGAPSGGSRSETVMPPASVTPTICGEPCTNDTLKIGYELPEDHDETPTEDDEDDGEHGEECGCCEDGGSSLGSFRIRIPFGESAKDEQLGYLWTVMEGPTAVTPSAFGVLAAQGVSVATNANGSLSISCSAVGGKSLTVTNIAHGVAVSVWNSSGRFESRWEVYNEDGDMSCIRVRRVTVLGNATVDETYATWMEEEPTVFEEMRSSATVWVRSDNIRGVTKKRYEWRDGIEHDFISEEYDETWLAGNLVRAEQRTYAKIGEGSVARRRLSRTCGYDERGCYETVRTYWCDTDHPDRHARLKSMRSDLQPWAWYDYDASGRETVRIEQLDGSPFPELADVSPYASLPQGCSAKITATDYAPRSGDFAHRNDSFEPREVSVYVRHGANSPILVSHETRIYTRETDAAGNPLRRIVRNIGLGGTARTETTVEYPQDSIVQSHLRGLPIFETAPDGTVTTTEYALSGGNLVATVRRYGSPSQSQSSQMSQFPTYTVTISDAAYRLPLRDETRLTSGGALLEWSERTYDDIRRLRSVSYSDGTSETNAYSCCRLLWRRDREGRKTLRSAQTGTDSLYYAEEETWLTNLTGRAAILAAETGGQPAATNGFKVTQHFFDGLGREMNTVTYAGSTPGEAVTPSHSSQLSQMSQTSTEYLTDAEFGIFAQRHTDERGKVTETFRYFASDCEETIEVTSTNGVESAYAITTSVRNGPRTTYREWPMDDPIAHAAGMVFVTADCSEETSSTSYAPDGRRIDYVVTESSDNSVVTNSVSTYDLLGRLVTVAVPGANGSTEVTSNFYDGASSRLLQTVTTGKPLVQYVYSELGERIGTIRGNRSVWSETSYETISQQVYRVVASVQMTGSATNSVRIQKTQLTGLSDACRRHVIAISRWASLSNAVSVTETTDTFDPDTGILTSVSQTDGRTPVVTRSIYGLPVERTTLDEHRAMSYDALGRNTRNIVIDAATGATNRIETLEYDVSDNVTCRTADYGADGTAVETAEYDMLGREVRRTDAFGQVTETAHDPLGRPVAVDGDTYPLRLCYDTQGRKTSSSTTRDDGATWDETRWEYDPASGLNTAKEYADGSRIAYAYADSGLRTRTTWARGAWKENAYNERNLVSGTTYSGADTPSVAYTYHDSDKIASAMLSDGTSYAYGYDDSLQCTNESATLGQETFSILRTYDGLMRDEAATVVLTNVRHSAKTRLYDSESRVCGYALTNSLGRGVDVAIAYDGSYVTNMVYVLPNGITFAAGLTRKASRKHLVVRRDYSFDGSPTYWYSTDYDLLNRPTNATDSVSLAREWLYNRRSELAAATIGTNLYGYAYDTIGNRLWAADNAITNEYAANSLNQYTTISNFYILNSPFSISHDADGNMTGDGTFDYAYDAENRLLSVTSVAETNGAIRVLNAYDHRARRIRKTVKRLSVTVAPPPAPPIETREWETVATHTFVWDGNNIVLEKIQFANGATRTVEYFWGMDKSGTEQGAGGVEGLLVVSVDGVFYIPFYDHNGNIVRYVSETGTIAAQYTYDPYGNVTDTCGDLADMFSFGFSTKYHDRVIGMICYQERVYSPVLGRWLNRDPIEEEGGENLYAFCENDAISKYDALGRNVTLTTGNRNASWWQVGNRFYHQEICVDTWSWNPKSCCWRKSGRSCYSFAATGFGFGGPGSDWLGMNSIKGPGILRGEVYPTGDQGLEDTETLETTPCQDRAFLDYLRSMDGREDTYSLGRHSCRTFSQAMMEEAKRRKNSGGCKNDKKCE